MTYRREDGLQTSAQQLLRHAGTELADYAPGGVTIVGSGGKGSATYTPWVGFFDPDETTDPQEGIYVVYLFAQDLASVTLTLNQGMEHLRSEIGNSKARARLAVDALAIREGLTDGTTTGLLTEMDLSSNGDRQRNYQAGNIIATRYELVALPDDAVLERDLDRYLGLYEDAIAVKRELLLTNPGSVASPTTGDGLNEDPLRNFKPKDDSEYVSYIVGRKLGKSRRHETLVRQYGEWVHHQGLVPSTEHPRDLVLRRGDDEWLIEAKVVYLHRRDERGACRARPAVQLPPLPLRRGLAGASRGAVHRIGRRGVHRVLGILWRGVGLARGRILDRYGGGGR